MADEVSQLTQSDRYSEADLTAKAQELVRFLLSCSARKSVVKRQEITEKLMKDMHRAFNLVLERAQLIMSDTFGLNIVELEKPNKTFCLCNSIELDIGAAHLSWSDADNQHTALLMYCLAVIFMSGEVLPEEVLWKSLSKLGLNADKVDDKAVFRDVRTLIAKEFVQQGYLIYKKVANTDPIKFEFTWGPRAHAMTSQEDVLSFVCQIYDNMEMYDWPQQYDLIHGEGAAAEARQQSQQSQQASQSQTQQ